MASKDHLSVGLLKDVWVTRVFLLHVLRKYKWRIIQTQERKRRIGIILQKQFQEQLHPTHILVIFAYIAND